MFLYLDLFSVGEYTWILHSELKNHEDWRDPDRFLSTVQKERPGGVRKMSGGCILLQIFPGMGRVSVNYILSHIKPNRDLCCEHSMNLWGSCQSQWSSAVGEEVLSFKFAAEVEARFPYTQTCSPTLDCSSIMSQLHGRPSTEKPM